MKEALPFNISCNRTLVLTFDLQGAATSCYVALHPNMKGVSGKYFVDCNEFKSSRFARNEVLAKKLWDFSNKLVYAAQNS